MELHRLPRCVSTPSLALAALARATACVLAACALATSATAGELQFSPPQFLPGDTTIVEAAGHQELPDIAAGGGGFLAVWEDLRSSLDDVTSPEGSGWDVYGALLDGAGNVVECFAIYEGFGDQHQPQVAWNGENWLVAWIEPKPTPAPIYEWIRGVRVAPDGTVLDPTPIVIDDRQTYYSGYRGLELAGGPPDGWAVAYRPNAGSLTARRVRPDGTLGLLRTVTSNNAVVWDIAFAQDEYLIVWSQGSGPGGARRYNSKLQSLSTHTNPLGWKVASDGDKFLVVEVKGSPPISKLEAMLLDHDGTVAVPRFTVVNGTNQTSPSGEGVGFDGTNYWVTWGGDLAARVSPTGVLIDTTPLTLALPQSYDPAYATAPGGGLQWALGDGGGYVGNPRDVQTARVSPAGVVSNVVPASVGTGAQVEPSFARGAGVNMLAFRSRSSDAARILVQRLDDAGTSLDAEPIEVASGPVQGLTAPSLDAPQVAWNGSVFMVTWSDTINVLARRIHPDGTFVDVTPLVIMPGRSTAVGALGATFLVGGSEVVYSSGTLRPPGALRVARVDGATGAVLDVPPIMVGGASDRHPHIVTLGGRWLVVWESVTYDPWSSSVFYAAGVAFVEADGTPSGQLATQLSRRPNVAAAGDRALLVAVDHTVPGGYTDLEARILMADGTFLGPKFLLSNAFEDQLQPAATWNGSEFVVAWEDKRHAVAHFDERADIYGARVSAEGVVLDPTGVQLAADPAPELRPELLSIGGTTLMAVSTLRSEAGLGAYRLGIHSSEVGIASYCTAGTSASGCQALLSSSGTPSGSATSGFTLIAAGVEGQKDGLYFFGANGRQANPWGSGSSYQCVAPPVMRGGLLTGSGTTGACDGSFAQDLNALWCPSCPKPAKNPGAGALVQAQLWYRDPQNTSNQTTSLSDALEFQVAP